MEKSRRKKHWTPSAVCQGIKDRYKIDIPINQHCDQSDRQIILEVKLEVIQLKLKKLKFHPYSASSVGPVLISGVWPSALRWYCHTSAVGGHVFPPNPRLPSQ